MGMKASSMTRKVLMLVAVSACLSGTTLAQSCSRLMSLPLTKARIASASPHFGSSFAVPGGQTLRELPPFCRVTVVASPVPGSLIHIEVWLPRRNWNGRLLGSGNGGYAGTLEYAQLVAALRHNFVSMNSDAGTAPASPANGDALIGRSEQWEDWSGRAVHVMTVIGKQVAAAYFGRQPSFSYFCGCSTGGQQGLAEAQRYPRDYDGILSGAAANDRTRVHTAILWNFEALQRGEQAGLFQEAITILHKAVLHACPTEPASDAWLLDPHACTFDPQRLLCSEKGSLECLNQGEIDAAKQIYDGPSDTAGRQIYPGLERGSELGWFGANGGMEAAPPFGSIFKWVWGIGWDWHRFRFDSDLEVLSKRLGASLNATEADLTAFASLKHKLILYHGWGDPLIAPAGSMHYFEQVQHATGKTRGQTDAQKTFARLYLIPGLGHCAGGIAFKQEDLLSLLMKWVEEGTTPGALTLPSVDGNQTGHILSVNPYPGVTKIERTTTMKSAARLVSPALP